MFFPTSILLLASAITSVLASPVQWNERAQQAVLDQHVVGFPARQTKEEAASSARRMVIDQSTGTLGTVFPASAPLGLEGRPFSLMEYQAPHPKIPSSILYLLMPISTSVKNILGNEGKATVTLANKEGTASKERVALIGTVTPEHNLTIADAASYTAQYLKYHPDAAGWLPTSTHSPHASFWATFTPEEIYYVGGFGDTHYIGWIERELWEAAKP
ncbi:pyridoxamine 5'-phosphate oxidase-domain-containing protein [Mrakia frigida]|uniref:pyridoxamine 5'-phosphate oxidase-domain-containing protein n=1 Tax=Mrakia frigida TaxID=29902 RepID=UPI003FCBEFFE